MTKLKKIVIIVAVAWVARAAYVSYKSKKDGSKLKAMIGEYVFGTEDQAESVLNKLIEAQNKHGHVAVSDYFDCIGIQPTMHDHTEGWTRPLASRAYVVKVDRGYAIEFPALEAL